MSVRTLFTVLLLLPLLGGCAIGRSAGAAGIPPSAPVPREQGRGAPATELPSTAQRLLVQRVWLLLEAEEPAGLASQAERITATAGGHVESLALDEGERLRAVLRVPAPRLEEVIAALERLGEVEEKRVSAADVTEESADLEARLRTLVAVRDRLRQYLERAEGVPDIIAVERELARVQSEIEILGSVLAAWGGGFLPVATELGSLGFFRLPPLRLRFSHLNFRWCARRAVRPACAAARGEIWSSRGITRASSPNEAMPSTSGKSSPSSRPKTWESSWRSTSRAERTRSAATN